MLEALQEIQEDGLNRLKTIADADSLEQWRVEFLGSNGRLKDVMPMMRDVPKEQKPEIGKLLNQVKQALESAFEEARQSVTGSSTDTSQPVDVTEPGTSFQTGCRHVITRTIEEIIPIFGRMGFDLAHGPEVEDEWHNFIALNIPADHPARSRSENFYLAGEGADRLLRSQTSTVQIRVMEQSEPPLKVISVGRVYRPDTHDATHYSMFHQVEGLAIDRNVTMVDLKTTLFQFARAYFGPEAQVRMRPSFFPFTEPSAEVDMYMPIKGTMQWVELGGCGMVDPNVLEAVGYDPEEWTGDAFGLGIERIAMRKFGIADIRWLYENQSGFLGQFA